MEKYPRSALVHQLKLNYGRALSLLQADLSRLNEENVADVIGASVILFFLGLASSAFVLQEEAESGYSSVEGCVSYDRGVHTFHSWVHFLKDVILTQSIADQSKLLPKDSPMLRLLSNHGALIKLTDCRDHEKIGLRELRIDLSGIGTHGLYYPVHRTWSTALGRLRKLFGAVTANESFDDISKEHSAALMADIDGLYVILLPLFPGSERWDRAFGAYPALVNPASSPFRRIFMWPSTVSITMIRMMQKNDPAALTLYAHFLVFVILLEGIRTVNDMGRRGIEDILRFVDKQQRVVQDENRRSHFDVMAAMEWPVSMTQTAR